MNSIITGAGTGIGAAAAYHLATRGVHVALVGRRSSMLETVAERIQSVNGSASLYPTDISLSQNRQAFHTQIIAKQPDIHMLLHNAAQLSAGELDNFTAEEIQDVIDTNLTAAIDLTRLFLPQIIQSHGIIAFVLSNASVVPMPYMALYGATKAGLQVFARSLRFEVGHLGVRVQVIYPPDTRTPMTAPLRQHSPINFPLANADQVGRWIAEGLLAGRTHIHSWDGSWWLRAAYHVAPALVETLLRRNRHYFANFSGERE